MPENLTRQILREHLTDGELTPGEAISLRIDQTLLQDATGTMALMQFEQLEVPRVKVDRAVQYVDGLVPAVWVGSAVLALGALVALLVPGRRAVAVENDGLVREVVAA